MNINVRIVPNGESTHFFREVANYLADSYESGELFTESIREDAYNQMGTIIPAHADYYRGQFTDRLSDALMPVDLLLSDYLDPSTYPDDAKAIKALEGAENCFVADSIGYEGVTRADLVTVADVVDILAHS